MQTVHQKCNWRVLRQDGNTQVTIMKEEIFALHKGGKSYRQIQKELGCSKGTIAYHLGTGQKEKVLKSVRQRRSVIRSYINLYKQERGCMDCKEMYPYWMLEFDHLSDKKFNISGYRKKTNSLETIKAEIAKCEVVCSNCHRIRTFARNITSGTDVMDISEFYSQ